MMTRVGLRLTDIGEVLPWTDVRDFITHLPPTADCATYRARFPKSWWWQPDHDFLAAVLNAVQWSNWQRGGGKGDKPKPVKRPKEDSVKAPKTVAELEAKRNRVKTRREVRRGR